MIGFTKAFASGQFILITMTAAVMAIAPEIEVSGWFLAFMWLSSAVVMCILSLLALIAENIDNMGGH